MTVKERVENVASELTASERKLASALLADYPYAGLVSIQELAKRAEVSAPSITRFVAKIGLGGYQEFQRDLLLELKEGEKSPVELQDRGGRPAGGYLSDFIGRATTLMADSAQAITEDQFARICKLLSDPQRSIYALGGRASNTIAFQLSFHLRQARKDVFHLPSDVETWPEYLLRMRSGDALFIADFRRYQTDLERLAEKASARGVRIVLMTDKWLSPVARHAAEVLAVPIESGTLWDTYTPALAVIEAIVTRIAEDNWEQTRTRIRAWDEVRIKERDSDK
ncbi:MAG: MurR/RpiR family transcriptional regulator [Rhizobiaceae bacterium]